MTCPCGNKSHDRELLLDTQARTFIKAGTRLHEVWKNWSDPDHKNFKGSEYMQRLKDRINKIKAEAA